MHWLSFAGCLLLVSGSARALPQGSVPSVSPRPPSIGSLGTLQTLKYNNLGPENNGSAAVLVYDRLPYDQAKTRCAAIGETLLPLQGAPQANRTELEYQVDYLVFVHDLSPSDSLWVGGSDCLAYSHQKGTITPISCDANLPALCTSKLPPTTDRNRAAVPSSQISISAGDLNVTGYRDGRSFRFMGIPFANPPVKDLRFAPPHPYTGPRTIDATRAAASCIQSESSFGTLGNGGVSEDCLYLNVYTPILPKGENNVSRPVAVYFYGGAFTSGSASMIDYDGGNFASRNDVVIVTVNYRVGALGWLATGNITTGSYGTRDQILALKWVQQHIVAFGGDPSHVTIFGQSAGGQSVVALLSSTAAKGLFSGAIVQSAPLDLPWFTRQVYAEIVAPEVAKAVGCDGDDAQSSEGALLSCLRSVPATDYLDNSTAFEDAMSASSKALADDYLHVSKLLASIEPLMPMVDDSGSGVIDDQFHTLMATERLPNRVPTMFTTVVDEASLYVADYIPNLGATQVGLDLLFSQAYTPELSKLIIKSDAFPLNRSDPDGVRNVGADALTHSEWTCAQSYLLSSSASSSSFPRLYEVQIADGHIQTTVDVPDVCSPNDNYNATCHAADVLPIWGTLNSKTRNVAPYYSADEVRHSQLLNDVFGSFFRTRDPNPNPEFLSVRGPAYQASLEKFVGKGGDDDGYQVPEFRTQQEQVSLLGVEPGWAVDPGMTDKCRVFREYGFTFQNANYTG